MNWLKKRFNREPTLSKVPRRGGTIDEELEAYIAGTGKGIPGIIESLRVFPSLDGSEPISHREKLVFNLQDFVRQEVVPNAVYLTVYQEAPTALLRLAAPPEEFESIKLALQARRTRFVSNYHRMPTYPILQLVLAIYDQPEDPFKVEGIRDITLGAVQGFITGLCRNGWFKLFFYDRSGDEFFFETQLAVEGQDCRQLAKNLNKATKAYWRIPEARRDFEQAYQDFINRHSLEQLQVPLR